MHHDTSDMTGAQGRAAKEERDIREFYSVNPHYHNMLVSEASTRALSEIESQNARRRALLMSCLSVFAVFVLGVSGFLINTLLNVRIEEVVREEMRLASHTSRFRLDAAQLSYAAQRLDSSDGFNQSEAQDLISSVGNLYTTYVVDEQLPAAERLANEEALALPARMIVSNFAQADRGDLIVQMETLTPNLFRNYSDPLITVILAFDLLAATGGAGDWGDDAAPLFDAKRVYDRHVAGAERAGFPEFQILFEMFVRGLEDETSEAQLLRLARSFDDLDDNDKLSYIKHLVDLRSGYLGDENSRPARAARIAGRVEETLRRICPIEESGFPCDDLI